MNVHINPAKAWVAFLCPKKCNQHQVAYHIQRQFNSFIIESFSLRFPAITSGRLKAHKQNRSSHLIAY